MTMRGPEAEPQPSFDLALVPGELAADANCLSPGTASDMSSSAVSPLLIVGGAVMYSTRALIVNVESVAVVEHGQKRHFNIASLEATKRPRWDARPLSERFDGLAACLAQRHQVGDDCDAKFPLHGPMLRLDPWCFDPCRIAPSNFFQPSPNQHVSH